MRSPNVLNVIIDERKQLEQLDDLSFLTQYANRRMGSNRQIFRDYILSSEVFKIDNGESNS